MASREKRPLAPSKTKQKASNDSGLPLPQNNRKRSAPTVRQQQQQLARDFLDAVASGSQLSPKLDAALPRKNVLRLRRKQKLRNAKANLIKVKVTKKVPIKNLPFKKKGLKLKKLKRLVEPDRNAGKSTVEERADDTENEASGKSSKNNLRTKKKSAPRGTEETTDIVPSSESRDSVDATIVANPKNSPKTTRKLKTVEIPDSPARSVKASKTVTTVTKRNASKERETIAKQTRSVGKDSESPINSKSNSSSPETKNLKKNAGGVNTSVDLTIEAVVASMVSDTEHEDCQVIGGKITRSRKMLIDEKLFTDVEIKKEVIDAEEARSASEDDGNSEIHQESQNSIQLRNRSSNSFTQRSLRNGKLRQLSDSGIAADLELKKRRWLNMDESNANESGAEMSVDNASDGNIEADYSFSESSGTENPSNAASSKDETSPTKLESPTDFDRVDDSGMEVENNNNSERMDRAGGEVGPILRSKTKAKSTEVEIKIEEGDSEEPRPLGRSLAGQLEPRKSGSLDQLRKDSLPKLVDKPPKSRRSSLNIDVKKTMNSFYGAEKTENASKSHIDLMIESIKLGIAKSIESKISRSEKSLVLNKNFEIPKIEEIVAPLSAESQKLGLEEIPEEDKPNVSKNDGASNSSDNSVPKVADTAKEIEKLVMGDVELVDTQNSESANVEVSRDEQQVVEQQVESSGSNGEGISRTSENTDKNSDEDSKKTDIVPGDKAEEAETASDSKDTKKSIVTRKSLRIKTSNESIADLDNSGKSSGSVEDSESSMKDEMKEAAASSVETPKEKPIESESSTVEASVSTEPIAQETEKTVAEKIPVDSNISLMSEDSETLESISKEVERLVGEASIMDTETNETPAKLVTSNQSSQKSTEIIVNKENSEPEETEASRALASDDATESTSLKQDSPQKCTVTTNAATEASETVEAATTHKTNCPKNNQDTSTESFPKNPSKENSDRPQESVESQSETGKIRSDKNAEEQKSAAEENRRVLRARDKLKKAETKSTVRNSDANETKPTVKGPDPAETTIKIEAEVHNEDEETPIVPSEEQSSTESKPNKSGNSEVAQITIKIEEPEPPVRTRRSREVKRRKEELSQSQNSLKNKRSRREVRKSDQQNKEETLLDNEVATINENNRSLVDKSLGGSDSLRGFSEGGRGLIDKLQNSSDISRSKSENDIENVKSKSECSGRLSHERAESDTPKENENVDGRSDSECKIPKTPEISQKDSDDASTSGESSSSSTLNSIIHETAEDKAEKEKILRLLGLETLEQAAQRMNHQKAKKEQYTGTLKTVIRVQKNKDKKRSRSPLKMVLKQGRGDGEGDSPEFYTIQKEFGASGVGDSSSGANRKFSTNHRYSCEKNEFIIVDENNEEAPPKDRQSLVIPEKSSSFSIHPGRCCADVCCHCGGKFGSLDTPMHLAQMKSDERRQKILTMQKLLNEDSCICDACYRCVDRKANTSPTNMQTKPHRQLMVLKCSARECREPARHSVKRRWLQRIKARLHNQVDINWESSQHTSMPFCVHHYSKIERFLTCALCTRRLAKNHTHRLAPTETEELNERLRRQGIPVHLVGGTFVCKLCRYFTQLQLKYKYVQNMNASSRSFFKDYRIRMLKRYDIEVFDCEEDDALPSTSREESLPGTSKDKDKRNKKVKCTPNKGAGTSKSPDGMSTSITEKLTIEPIPKSTEGVNSEPENDNRVTKLSVPNDEAIAREVQLMDLESTVEKLKKRKALEQHIYPSETSITCETRGSDVVEILAMDKEVTLTRLPKRPRVSTDITPVVQRLGANPSISVRTLFPGEEEMNLHANVEFTNVREVTPQGWEKCATMIQYDRDTKVLWQELQRPYGNQSSFLRHLILLEKYYRSGDLVLAPNASRNAINYSTSVQNRLISYEGPEKMDEPIMEPISSEYSSSRRLSGGYMMERDRLSLPSTSSLLSSTATKSTSSNSSTTTTTTTTTAATTASSIMNAVTQASGQSSPPRVLKLTSGVSIIKKPPPNLQRLHPLPSGSSTNGGATKRKETVYPNKFPVNYNGKVIQLSEGEFKRLLVLKQQKKLNAEQKQTSTSGSSSSSGSNETANATATSNSLAQYQKVQMAAQKQFQKHLRMQQERLNRQTRGDFEPLICDVRSLTNENTPTQNLLNNLNLPKSIQVTTKPPNPIPILPKIPKSLTVIPQTVPRTLDK